MKQYKNCIPTLIQLGIMIWINDLNELSSTVIQSNPVQHRGIGHCCRTHHLRSLIYHRHKLSHNTEIIRFIIWTPTSCAWSLWCWPHDMHEQWVKRQCVRTLPSWWWPPCSMRLSDHHLQVIFIMIETVKQYGRETRSLFEVLTMRLQFCVWVTCRSGRIIASFPTTVDTSHTSIM